MKIKLVILDFYGTIVHEDDKYIKKICTEISDNSPFNPDPKEISIQWYNEFKRICSEAQGNNFKLQKDIEKESITFILKKFKCPLDPDVLSGILFDYWSKPDIFPESLDVISKIKIDQCILSNIDNNEINKAVKYHNMPVKNIITSEICRCYKPDKKMFETVINNYKFKKNEMVMVGDSYSPDVIGAKQFGIPAMWINRLNKNITDKKMQPDFIAKDLNDLLTLLKN